MIQMAKFRIGQIIEHNRFNYRGVIFEVDPVFSLTDEWYETVARSRPPKDRPWYHVLVDNSVQVTYVAERHLAPATDTSEIRHPSIEEFFSSYRNGRYMPRQQTM
jgi:heat shock protein HspQ